MLAVALVVVADAEEEGYASEKGDIPKLRRLPRTLPRLSFDQGDDSRARYECPCECKSSVLVMDRAGVCGFV